MSTNPETDPEKVAMKKLSLEIPAEDHRAIKMGAASRGQSIRDDILELCRARNGRGPWPADVVESVLGVVESVLHQAEAEKTQGRDEH